MQIQRSAYWDTDGDIEDIQRDTTEAFPPISSVWLAEALQERRKSIRLLHSHIYYVTLKICVDADPNYELEIFLRPSPSPPPNVLQLVQNLRPFLGVVTAAWNFHCHLRIGSLAFTAPLLLVFGLSSFWMGSISMSDSMDGK